MDYEKAYKDALDWAKSVYPTAGGALKEELERYFPDVKEDDDERIIEWLILQLQTNYKGLEKANKAIAWLEKQKDKEAIPEELVRCYNEFSKKMGDDGITLMNAINMYNIQQQKHDVDADEYMEQVRSRESVNTDWEEEFWRVVPEPAGTYNEDICGGLESAYSFLQMQEFARHFANWQYQKDRLEFAKLKVKEWQDGFNAGVESKEQQIMAKAIPFYDILKAVPQDERDTTKVIIIKED